jgi:hypothetical protein
MASADLFRKLIKFHQNIRLNNFGILKQIGGNDTVVTDKISSIKQLENIHRHSEITN